MALWYFLSVSAWVPFFIMTSVCGFSTSPCISTLYHLTHTQLAAINGLDQDNAPCDTKTIFLLSDGTGVTLKSTIQKSLAQFSVQSSRTSVQTRLFSFIRGEQAAASIIQNAHQRDAMIISTVADPALRDKIQRMCELSNVPVVDLLGPTLDGLSSYLGESPVGQPLKFSSIQSSNKRTASLGTLGDSYYKRIEAVEFTLKADDGQSPWLLKDADVILVGVSRSGKTPLSVILSQTSGLKVANVPLVMECPLPKELLNEETIDSRRIFCLTIAPSELKRIRTTRLERHKVKEMEDKYILLGGDAKSNYADRNYVLRDLKNAHDMVQKHNWTQIDVTGRAVEETASYISELLNERTLLPE